jgi:branched-chain amino acid transport system substrate-binding protein
MYKSSALKALVGIGMLVLVAAAVTCRPSNSPRDQAVSLGAVLAQSGDSALWGQNARKAMELILDEVNSAGGIDGRQVRVIYEDSQGDPKAAVSAFRKLASVNKVPVVLGDMLTSTTLAMAPLANQDETVLIGISCSSPAITDAGPFVYRVWPSDLYEGKVFAEYVFAQKLPSVAIIYLNNDYGNGLKDAFKSRFLALGGRVLDEEAYLDTDRDFRAIAAKVKAVNPNAVYIVGYYEDTGRVIRDLRQMGVSARLLGTSSAIHEKLLEIAGQGAEGFTAAVVNDFDLESLTEEQKAFVAKYRDRYGSDPDWAATHGADALLVALDCLRNGKTTGKEAKDFIDARRTFHGINQGVKFDENGDVVEKPIAVKEVRGGKFTTIWSQ